MKKFICHIKRPNLCLLSLFLLLFGVSCSRESKESPTEEPKVATEQVKIVLEGGADAEAEARLVQSVNTGTGVAVSGPILSGKDLNVRVAFKRGTSGTPVYYTLTFKKVVGANKIRYYGTLSLPSGTGTLYGAGIILSEVGGSTFATMIGDQVVPTAAPTTLQKADVSGKLATTIPYVADWQAVGSNSSLGAYELQLHFKPSGTLLRFKILNYNNASQTVRGIRIRTNAFVKDWQYDFTRLTGNNLKGGEALSGPTAVIGEQDYSYTLPSPVTLTFPQVTDWYYLWVMPISGTSNLKTSIWTNVGTASWNSYPFRADIRTSALKEGGVSINLRFGSYAIPLSYMAKYDVNSSGTGFATTNNNSDPDRGSFTQAEAKAINIPGYFLPTKLQWQSIFPSYGWHGTNFYPNGTSSPFSMIENFLLPADDPTATLRNRRVNYNGVGGNPLYFVHNSSVYDGLLLYEFTDMRNGMVRIRSALVDRWFRGTYDDGTEVNYFRDDIPVSWYFTKLRPVERYYPLDTAVSENYITYAAYYWLKDTAWRSGGLTNYLNGITYSQGAGYTSGNLSDFLLSRFTNNKFRVRLFSEVPLD